MENPLLSLLSLYMKGTITDAETIELFKLIDNFLLVLTNLHYKKLQDLWCDSYKERQRIRFDLFLSFVLENRGRTSQYILYSFRRRFSWVEMLVDCKLYGITLFDHGIPITKQMDSLLIRRLILGQNLYNAFVNKYEREPTNKEFLLLFIRYYLNRGKLIKFSVIEDSVRDCLKYFYCKKYADPVRGFYEGYDERIRKNQGYIPPREVRFSK